MTYSISFKTIPLTLLAALGIGCVEVKDKDSATAAANPPASAVVDTSAAAVPSYEQFSVDTAGAGARFASTPADDSAYSKISDRSASAALTRFPARIPKRGPAALQIQVMLDRAHFSPGIIDGIWGDNAAKALAYFSSPKDSSASMPAMTDSSTMVDQATYQRLVSAAGSVPAVTRYSVTAEDVKGPFNQIPDNVYEQAKLDCLCYANAAEAIAEKFHTSRKLLTQLNPGISLDSVAAGTALMVPNVEAVDLTATQPSMASNGAAGVPVTGQVARLIVSRKGYWTHAVDASGKILYHFPSTLGAGYDPSPEGGFKVTNIAWNPTFHYQPTLFHEVPNSKPEAQLPKGPNSPVGVVWMALSKPHYGIHGTSSPETIGYANSHGCVRLTNWDAVELGRVINSGVDVQFR
ncbi:MAG: L,D-transpeptidase [Gemmatimonadaceae bacterium]